MSASSVTPVRQAQTRSEICSSSRSGQWRPGLCRHSYRTRVVEHSCTPTDSAVEERNREAKMFHSEQVSATFNFSKCEKSINVLITSRRTIPESLGGHGVRRCRDRQSVK